MAFLCDERSAHRQFGRCQAERLARLVLTDAFDLQHYATGAHRGHPVVHAALTGTHAGFGSALGHRAIRKDADPDLAATAHVAHDGATSCLDLAAGDVVAFQRLQAVSAKRHRVAAVGLALEAATLQLAVFHTLWHQHSRFSVYLLRYVFRRRE